MFSILSQGEVSRDEARPRSSHSEYGLELRQGHAPSAVIEFVRAATTADAVVLDQVLDADMVVADHWAKTLRPATSCDFVIEALTTFGPNVFDIRLLAVRSELLALVRRQFARTEGGQADMLVVACCTPDNQVDRLIIHDTADLRGALASLGELYQGVVDAPRAVVLQAAARLVRAGLNRDFTDLKAAMSPDLRQVDNRDGGELGLDRDGAVSALRAVWTDNPASFDFAAEVHVLTLLGAVVSITQATVETLGLTDVEIVVMGVRDGLVDVFDFYDSRDLPAALRRFSELT